MILHVSLLTLSCIPIALTLLSINPKSYCSVTLMDTLVQLAICYICWTLGSSSKLRFVECVIVPCESGNHQIRFRPRQSVTAISDQIVTTECSNNDDTMTEEDSYLEGLRYPSILAYNERGVDEIV